MSVADLLKVAGIACLLSAGCAAQGELPAGDRSPAGKADVACGDGAKQSGGAEE